jgi:hypothetical protein
MILLRWTDTFKHATQFQVDDYAEFLDYGLDALIEARRSTAGRQKHDGKTRRNFRQFPALELQVYSPATRNWTSPVQISEDGTYGVPVTIAAGGLFQWIGERPKAKSDADWWREVATYAWERIKDGLEWSETMARFAGGLAEGAEPFLE